jgi:hypothetical protein
VTAIHAAAGSGITVFASLLEGAEYLARASAVPAAAVLAVVLFHYTCVALMGPTDGMTGALTRLKRRFTAHHEKSS